MRISDWSSDVCSSDLTDDVATIAGLDLDAVVLPKVDAPSDLDPLRGLALPVLAMIETPAAIYAAQGIAADPAVAGLIAGLNDLAYELKQNGRASCRERVCQ